MSEKQKRKPKQKRKRTSKQKVGVSSPVKIVAGMMFAVVLLSTLMSIFLLFAGGDSDFDLTHKAIQATNNDTFTQIAASATQIAASATQASINATGTAEPNPIIHTATALQDSFDTTLTPEP